MKDRKTTLVLWLVYVCLLLVLLPHTAWLFSQFEPDSGFGTVAGWAGGVAFEAAIAVLTHKQSQLLSEKCRLTGWRRVSKRYLNAYSLGLVASLLVSGLANLAHAVQFGRPLAIFGVWGVPQAVYQVAFGAVLPLVSLLFARVLSSASESEGESDPALEQTKTALAEARRQAKDSEERARQAEAARAAAEERFSAAGDLLAGLFAAEKRQRILSVRQKWPKLPPGAIAIITETSPGYVTDVIKETVDANLS